MTASAIAASLLADAWAGARCVTERANPNFFAPRGALSEHNRRFVRAVARRYCDGCPVIARCAEVADRDDLEGIWGGSHRHRAGRGPVDVTPLIAGAPGARTRKAAS